MNKGEKRRALLLNQEEEVVTGIDFIYVHDECDLRLKVASADNPEEEMIREFKMEFESKKKECTVLIVRETSDSEKWTIAGFSDAGEFRTVVIDDPSHELSEELKKEPINESRIVALATSTLGRVLFDELQDGQVMLDIHFLISPATLKVPLVQDLDLKRIWISSAMEDSGASQMPAIKLAWIPQGDPLVLRLIVRFPGSFSPFVLHIDDERIDPYFNDVRFSFQASCPSDLDCRLPAHECPPEAERAVEIDYQARDFWSLREALLSFASLHYPDWADRLEADAGVMLVEAMSALGDELAYYQDRVGREAYLETATQRRSLRRHARLLDYEIHDGLAASTWLDIEVAGGGSHELSAGQDIWAESDDGRLIYYEIGRGLKEVIDQVNYPVDTVWNRLEPHIWDKDDTCLPLGATELFVKGDYTGQHKLPWDGGGEGRASGCWLLLKTEPMGRDIPARRWLVRVLEDKAKTLQDRLLGEAVTRLVWEEAQALPFELDLTILQARANLVPATVGRTETRYFIVGYEPDDPDLRLANNLDLAISALSAEDRGRLTKDLTRPVERQGPEGSTIHLYSLPDSAATPLCWRGEDPRTAAPELRLVEVEWKDTGWAELNGKDKQDENKPWGYRRSPLAPPVSTPDDTHFTLDDGTWERVVAYYREGKEIVHRDYASGAGTTLRFGDGVFGQVPEKGTVFKVEYRLGNGRRGNVAADSLTHFRQELSPFVQTVTNPFPAIDGLDPETPEEIRQLAPEAFRAITYRAVRAEDYAEAAERLAWVQRAGATRRWTGSWLTTFVTADPSGAVSIDEKQHQALSDQLDRFRQTGHEAYAERPRYADIDLEITVCVGVDAYRGEVKARVLEVLIGQPGHRGFFSADNFTFGTPLKRSQLEATVQQVPGVRAVGGIRLRRRGFFDWRLLTGPYLPLGDRVVLRLENDPSHPERGSLRLIMEGGA